MARELKDELNTPKAAEETKVKAKSPIQIEVDKDLEEVLTEIVCQDYDKAKDYRDTKEYGKDDKGLTLKFKEWLDALRDLYYGNRPFKTIPWKYCSNRSLKIAQAIVEMLHSRLYAAVWNESLIRWRPGGVEDVDKVKRINTFMNWWIRVKARLGSFFDGWVKTAIAYGDVTTRVGWEVKEYDTGQTDSTKIMGEDGNQLANPDGSDAVSIEKRFKREENTKANIIAKEDIFLQPKAKGIEEDPLIIRHRYLYSQLESMEKKGRIVNLDKVRENIDKLIELPEKTPTEKMAALKQVKRRNIPVNVIEWYGRYDVDDDDFEEDIRLLVDPENKIFLGGVLMTVLTKNGKRPLDITKFNLRLEDPEGLEGYGVLEQVKELAEEIDACFNQLTDSNTLSIMRPGFYDPSGDVDAPTLRLAPNQMAPVSNPTKNVFFPDFNIDTTRLLNAIRMVMEFIERLTGASSYVMGKESDIVGGSGTATRTQAIVQSAEQRFSTPAQRLQAGAARILSKILDQIQLNIPPGLEMRVLGEKGEPLFKAGELTDEGISGEFDAYLLEDSSMGDKNMERQIMDMLYQSLMQNVLVMSDPVKIDKVTRNFVTAYTSKTEADELLGPAPERKDYDTPEEENTLMIQGDFAKVRALMPENHLQHMMVHQELLSSPSFAEMPKGIAEQVYQYAQGHIQEHAGMFQQAMNNAIALKGGQGGQQPGQNAPGQGNASGGGMAPGSGPLGQVLNEKRTGESKQATDRPPQ